LRKILVVQNASCEDLGTLQPLFENDGFGIDAIIPAQGENVPNKLDNYKAFVILGGPASVYDQYQYLKDEERLIKIAATNDIPTLGICLGSQLVAKATGARVYKGSRKEIGWYPVELTNDGINGIFKGLKKSITVFQWHGDTYGLLKNAITLAKSELYPAQAFKVGSAIGIQFHLEVSKDMIMDWIQEYSSELESVRDYINVDDIIAGLDANVNALNEYSGVLYRNFRKLIK